MYLCGRLKIVVKFDSISHFLKHYVKMDITHSFFYGYITCSIETYLDNTCLSFILPIQYVHMYVYYSHSRN